MRGTYDHVFTPIVIKGVEYKNRIEVSPTIPYMATSDGLATQEMVEYHRALARSGAGIVNIGDSMVNFRWGKNHEGQLDLGRDDVITGLSQVWEGISRYGAMPSIELNHGGHHTFLKGLEPFGVSPLASGVEEYNAAKEGRLPGGVRQMDQDQIELAIQDFADAAHRCMGAGFKMILVHGAHGHLLFQFLSPLTNKRTDRWGGSLENRARFPIAVLDAIRKKCGSELVIEYRISLDEKAPDGFKPDEAIAFLKMIEDKIDIVHVSAGMITHPFRQYHIIQPHYLPPMYNVHYAAMVKEKTNLLVTTVGAIANLDQAEQILSEGKADFVAMARAILAEPELIRKAVHGKKEDIRPCIRCNWCTGHSGQIFLSPRCSVNPIAFRNIEFPTEDSISVAKTKKKVAVVGGGPAGMQAALTSVRRGHDVVLYEMTDHLGGMLAVAAESPSKELVKQYLHWLVAQTERSGATIKFNTEVTADTIKRDTPDALIIAVGATPCIPNIPGVDKPFVHWAGDVEAKKLPVGGNVIIAGAGLTGVELALELAEQGKRVSIFEMLGSEAVLKDAAMISMYYLLEKLAEKNIPIITNAKVDGISDSGVLTVDNRYRRKEYAADTVILATGMDARKDKVRELRRLIPETEVFVVGDCYQPRNVAGAVHDGFNAAVDL